MTLSAEWLDFLARLAKNGPMRMDLFPTYFNSPDKAKRLLGEIIRQGLVDVENDFSRLFITPKGRELVKGRSFK